MNESTCWHRGTGYAAIVLPELRRLTAELHTGEDDGSTTMHRIDATPLACCDAPPNPSGQASPPT